MAVGDKADKTEKPTPKRRREAKKKGQVARSPDVAGWASMLAMTVAAPAVVRHAQHAVLAVVGQATHVMAAPSEAGAVAVLAAGLRATLSILAPVLGLALAVGVAANVAQVGLALRAPQVQWHRLNPLQGLKRLFSVGALWELGKQAAKLAVLGIISYRSLAALGHQVLPFGPADLAPLVGYTGNRLLGLVRGVALAGLLLSVVDFAFQRRQLTRSLRMSKQEVKEEMRQNDGDPMLRARIRRKQRMLSRMRMMAAVAGADVVVVNPTHYAVALRYVPGGRSAPKVVAKGVDELAARIREEAATHQVPVVEDPPLARAIYAACELDAQIPKELYVAVARVLAFVFTLPRTVRASGAVQRRRTSALVA